MANKLNFDVNFLKGHVDAATERIRKNIQFEMDAINNLGFNLDVYVGSIDVKRLCSYKPEQIAEVKLNVSL